MVWEQFYSSNIPNTVTLNKEDEENGAAAGRFDFDDLTDQSDRYRRFRAVPLGPTLLRRPPDQTWE